ncbi:MAG: hypothetical protein KDA74_12195, partial [Planctomycetaceae bacterium]|nr:hypothetical protein [Planctomycetaceae bacterium]
MKSMHQAGQKNSMQSDQPGVRDQKVVRLKEHTQTGSSSKLAHAIIALVFVVIFAAVLVLAWEIILALFMAVLFGVFLTHTSHKLSDWTPLPYNASLAAVVLILIGAFLGTTTFFFVQINQQIEEVHQQIDEGIERIHDWADKYISIGSVIRSTPFLAKMISTQNEKRKQKKAEQDHPEEKNQSGSNRETETKEQPSQNSFQSL